MACLGYPANLLWALPLYIAVSVSLFATGQLRIQAWVAILFSSGSLALAGVLFLKFPRVLSTTLKWGALGAGVTLVLMLVTAVLLLIRQPRDKTTR
jgi:hypothetical protein